jgi:AmmeMemoRadiSam system protein B
MPDQPKPEGGAGRIIVPGAEPEPEPGPKSRIILPPGVASETRDELPEYPKLRPLVLMPFSDGKRELILVNDPLGVIEGQPVLGIESLALLQLLDGTLSLNDIITAATRESKDIRIANMVRDFIAQLDDLLMLESPRFESAHRELREAYHALEIRPAALEGHSYPAEREALKKFLDEHFAAAEKMRSEAGEPAAPVDARPRAILAPHLDPRRAGPTIARAYLEIGTAPTEPIRVVVFGTGHSLLSDTMALTRKHFETPLGKATCDTAFVDAVAARLGDRAYASELTHREEHSIEFQVLDLEQRLGDRRFKIVPILCGGFHALLDQGKTPRDDAEFESMIQAVREAEQRLGGPTMYVAGVDFSHVGARFGDPPADERAKTETEKWDRDAIEAACRGDADAWFQSIAAHDDQSRICGLAPTYAMLRCAEPGTGRLLRYEQSDEPGGSFVSIASMVWP